VHAFRIASTSDKIVTSAVGGLAAVLCIIYAPLGSRKAKNLRARGRRTTGLLVFESKFSKHGSWPVTVEYTIDSETYRIKRDMPGKEVAEIRNKPVDLLYDPQKPSNAIILLPSIAALPIT
jgi:hypothetical protein